MQFDSHSGKKKKPNPVCLFFFFHYIALSTLLLVIFLLFVLFATDPNVKYKGGGKAATNGHGKQGDRRTRSHSSSQAARKARQRRRGRDHRRIDNIPAGHGEDATTEPKAGQRTVAIRQRHRLFQQDRADRGRPGAVPRAGAQPYGGDARKGNQAGRQRHHARGAGHAGQHNVGQAAGHVRRGCRRHRRAVPGGRNQPDGDCQDPDAGQSRQQLNRDGHCKELGPPRSLQGHCGNAAARCAVLAAVLPTTGAACAEDPPQSEWRWGPAGDAVRTGRQHGCRDHCGGRGDAGRCGQDEAAVVIAACATLSRRCGLRDEDRRDRGPKGVFQGRGSPVSNNGAAVWHRADDV